jgi:N-acetylglucosamine kinase-like BadF-type ATPase
MQDYVIGIDGGGTKTEICVSDREKNILLRFQGGAINYNGQSEAAVNDNIQNIFQKIRGEGFQPEACLQICIGVAGISNPTVKSRILKQVQSFDFQCNLKILGDQETALAGALNNLPGIILIAGTGSVCYGKAFDGTEYRAGGYGHMIDDAGSGYAIARDILAAVVRAQDGRGEKTVLTELVYRYLKLSSINELIGFLYDPSRSKKEIARLSVLIMEAYSLGDKAAIHIVNQTASDLVELSAAVLKQMQTASRLAVSGSILMKNEEIYIKFNDRMAEAYPELEIVKPYQDAAYGAVLLALQV